MRLAHQTGFKQPHITNFLNRKRSLSLDAMDRVLNVQKISVLDLMDPDEINKRAHEVIYVPKVEEHFQPLVGVVPLQLLAYHIALLRGCDIDKPRNLAKSVTVE